MNDNIKEAMLRDLSSRYGEVIGGSTLSRVLGFQSHAAMKQAFNRGTLNIPTFFIEGRRGRFALISDVAAWLAECRSSAGNQNSRKVPEGFRQKAKKRN